MKIHIRMGKISKKQQLLLAITFGKQYYNLYQVKLLGKKHFNLMIQVSKKEELAYGDKIELQGQYQKPNKRRNYGGYDEEGYLKTLKVVGRVKAKKIKVLAKKQINPILQLANVQKLKIEQKIEKNFEEEKANLLKGILLGETRGIQEELKEKFQTANISHILAISGMHISYLMIGMKILFQKLMGKKKSQIVTIIILIFYTFITGFSPSVVRAVIMGIISIGGEIFYRKNDVLTSISISLLAILVYNPFLLSHVGLQLSYLGTIGIILLYPTILKILEGKKVQTKNKIFQKVKEIIAVSLSAQIAILPILLYHFNTIGTYFLITNLFVSVVIGPIIILGFLSIFVKAFSMPVKIGLEFLIFISNFSRFPFSKIYIATPSIGGIFCYFLVVLFFYFMYSTYQEKSPTTSQRRLKNMVALFQYRWRQKKKRYFQVIMIVFFLIILSFCFIPKNLKIYFVDVGQGDCTFIVTPKNKTILIDGGGSITSDFDVGKKTVIPYLLDRGYTKLDYIIISHFDLDHVAGLLSVIEELKVKNVIISKQKEDTKQYQQFLKLVKEKKIAVTVVKRGNRIQIEKGIYFDILWPENNLMEENPLNNNSIVTQFYYNQFSMLFTGDIEEPTEKLLLEKKINLKADILKVAHHRF